MNKEQTKEQIEVMQAFVDGEQIEYCPKRICRPPHWSYTTKPTWGFEDFEYRVKREPRVFWVNEYEDGSFGTLHKNSLIASENLTFGKNPCVRKVIEVIE